MKSWHSTLWLVSVSESRRDDFAPVLVGRMRQKTRVLRKGAIDAKQYCLFRSKLTVAEGEGPTDRSELGE